MKIKLTLTMRERAIIRERRGLQCSHALEHVEAVGVLQFSLVRSVVTSIK